MQQTVAQYPKEDKIIVLADQLNIHLSASRVEWIAQQENIQQDLGKKGSRGILKDLKSRRTFLEDNAHRIQFVYTPRHCSWLNPIENWFARLQKQVIRYGNFASTENLKNKMIDYIRYYNKYEAKPLNWKFKGFVKNKEIQCIKT
ncbi:MAG: DDE endonuclease [Bacteroidia bacterium]|nr:DDE endonuclease [Bacteroidia bacterium]